MKVAHHRRATASSAGTPPVGLRAAARRSSRSGSGARDVRSRAARGCAVADVDVVIHLAGVNRAETDEAVE